MVKRAIADLGFFYGDKPNYGNSFDNGIWMHVLDIPWLTRIEESSLYKTIIRTLWQESAVQQWSQTIKTRYPHVRLIGLEDHPTTQIQTWHPRAQKAYIDDIQYLDGIMALTRESEQWYKIVAPSVPVEYVGLPFPFDGYEKKYGHFISQEREYIGLGVGAADNDRNFVSNLAVFRRLQLDNPDLTGLFLSIPHQLMQYCMYWADQIPNVFIHQRTEMGEFYEMLTRCKLVLNLADRNTPGRIQGEAAFFGIPVVGSNRLELQNLLWPGYSVSPYALEDAVRASEAILEDANKVREACFKAREGLEEFNYENSRARFQNLMKRIDNKL
jgi:hypothetical protein